MFRPRVLCPACGSPRLEWRPSAGLGTVYSATTVHSRGADPYTVALVDLDEGVRVMATLAGPARESGLIDARVEVAVRMVHDEPALLASLRED